MENPDLQDPSSARERALAQEWKAISQVQEESLRQLREQTAALGETCAAAASLALRGFDRAEARIEALESNLQERLTGLTHQIETTLAEMRRVMALQPGATPVAPFPLDGVVRIHDELRQRTGEAPRALPPGLDRVVEAAATAADETNARQNRYWMAGIAAASLATLILLGIRFERQVTASANQAAAAERRAQATTEDAARVIAATQAAADKQIAEAREAARAAQVVSGVVAAPDLVRFNLVAADPGNAASAQVLLSRSRGLVLSASQLTGPRAGQTYQTWLVTNTEPFAVGPLNPDENGRATLAIELPAGLRPVRGVMVTSEHMPVASRPGGETILLRPQPAPVPAEPTPSEQ